MGNKSGKYTIAYRHSEERSDEESIGNKRFFATLRMTQVVALFVLVLLFIQNVYALKEDRSRPFSKGEKIIYDIKKFKLKVGEATLVYNGLVKMDGQDAISIHFRSTGFNFLDEEEIYLDPKTFQPTQIKRNLNIFGIKEKIVEHYDRTKGKVRIVKTAKGKTTEQVLENGKPFDNIYGFIYRYRQFGQFNKGDEFDLHLPTRDVKLMLDERKEVEVAGLEYDAYHIKSTPKKFKVWFDSSEQKIPLMITGSTGFGGATMIMREYIE